MKIREMDIYFTVPVDRAVLAACRERAGYKTVAAFQTALKASGYSMQYSAIERCYNKRGGRVRGDVAEVIAEVMGLPVAVVFPSYNAARIAAEDKAEAEYYRPFTTITDRNVAIVAAMDQVRRTALKYCLLLKNQNGGHFLEQSDIISIAYESLVRMADRAMKKGIHKGATFEAAACVAVKNDFLRINKDNKMKCRKAELYSLDAAVSDDDDEERDWYNYRGGSYRIDVQVEICDECLRAIQEVPRDQWANLQAAERLIAFCFPAGYGGGLSA